MASTTFVEPRRITFRKRQWTFRNVMERLKALRRQRVKVGGVEFDQVAEAEDDQKEILDLLKSKKV